MDRTVRAALLIAAMAASISAQVPLPSPVQGGAGGGGGGGTITFNGQTVSLNGSGNVNDSAAAHSVALNEGAGSAISGATIGTAGRMLVDQGPGNDPAFEAMSGSCTMTSAGVITCTNGPTTNQNIREVTFVFDGGGSALSGTIDRCHVVDFGGTIKQVSIVADQSGSATIDVQTVSYASYTGPSSASTITSSDTPALSSAVKYQDSTLTGWTTSLTAGMVVCGKLTSPSTITWANMTLEVAAN